MAERNKQTSKLTEDNLESKRRLERQMSNHGELQAHFSGHLESIIESSTRGDLSDSEIMSGMPSMPSQ